jgi:hypothetical protein
MISRTLRTLTVTILVSACGDGYGVDDDYDIENQNSNATSDAGKRSDGGARDSGAKDDDDDVRADGGSGAPRDGGVDASRPSGDAGGVCATLTYETFAKQFFSSYCVSCHGGTAPRAGFRLETLAQVQARKAGIKTQVTSGNMPQGNKKPTADERTKLGQWVDCGAL